MNTPCFHFPTFVLNAFFFFFFSPRLSIYMKERVGQSCQIFVTPWTVSSVSMDKFLCPSNSPGKNTGEDCHSLLQGMVPTQGSSPGLLPCKQILYHLSHQVSPAAATANSLLGSRLRIFYVTGRNVNHEFQYLKRNYLQILHLLLISGWHKLVSNFKCKNKKSIKYI